MIYKTLQKSNKTNSTKNRDELRCSGRVVSSFSTSVIPHFPHTTTIYDSEGHRNLYANLSKKKKYKAHIYFLRLELIFQILFNLHFIGMTAPFS